MKTLSVIIMIFYIVALPLVIAIFIPAVKGLGKKPSLWIFFKMWLIMPFFLIKGLFK
jgi:hypothetical protein